MKGYATTNRSSQVIEKFAPFRARFKLRNRPHASMCAARLKACFATAYTCPLAYLTSFPLSFRIQNGTTTTKIACEFQLYIPIP